MITINISREAFEMITRSPADLNLNYAEYLNLNYSDFTSHYWLSFFIIEFWSFLQ